VWRERTLRACRIETTGCRAVRQRRVAQGGSPSTRRDRQSRALDTIHPISTDLPTIHLISIDGIEANRRNVDAWIPR
jgi:hypothetical protein